MRSTGRGWAWLGAGVLVISAGLAAEHAARISLERRAREVDLLVAMRGIGLEGRISPPRWTTSRFRWFPRPALRLKGVEASVLSGIPGPGAASGGVHFDAVDLVPRWGFPMRRGLERVEVRGGTVEFGPDLLPQVPRRYLDPISGTSRPIPWEALLRLIEAGGAGRENGRRVDSVMRSDRLGREPALVARDLEVRLPAAILPSVETVRIGEVRLFADGDRLELAGELRVGEDHRSWTVPVLVARNPAGAGQRGAWEFSLGSDSSGVDVRISGAGRGAPLSWSAGLRDPNGTVAQAFLDGRTGPMGRLRWTGPWSLEARGEGLTIEGAQEAVVRLRGGVLSLAGTDTPRTAVTGTVRILPGRVDVSPLLLSAQAGASEDSAEVRLQWLSTTGGLRLNGELKGIVDPGWIGLLGNGWTARGRLRATVTLDGTTEGRGARWSLVPRGQMAGTIARLRGPWFADSLTQGNLEAWSAAERLGFVLAGVWGTSPFRLEARDLPLADPRRPDYALAETRWDFTSPTCRLEDFGLDPSRFPIAGDVPFWLALPGRGEMHITHGSWRGVAVDSLSAEVDRRGDRFRIDQIDVGIAGGRVTGTSAPAGVRRSGVSAADTRLEIGDVDLRLLRPLLERVDGRFARGIDGRLSASLRMRWPAPGEGFSSGVGLDGSMQVVDGSLRGLPVQEELRRRTHLDQLAVLSFHELRTDISREDGRLVWNRLRLDAPPLRIEGAGLLDAVDSLRCVLTMRLAGGGADGLQQLLSSFLGSESSTIYAGVTGSSAHPDLKILSRPSFLRELDRLGGSLPTEGGELKR